MFWMYVILSFSLRTSTSIAGQTKVNTTLSSKRVKELTAQVLLFGNFLVVFCLLSDFHLHRKSLRSKHKENNYDEKQEMKGEGFVRIFCL